MDTRGTKQSKSTNWSDTNKMVLKYLFGQSKTVFPQMLPIFSLQLDITYRCNLRCDHCYQRNGFMDFEFESELTINDWKEIIRQHKKLTEQLNTRAEIIISGGEPLLSPILKPLIYHIREFDSSIQIFLLTNGTLLSETFATFLKEAEVKIQISLDGPTSSLHDAVRGFETFNKTISAIKLLHTYKIPFIFQAVLQKQNACSIPEFFKLARTLKANAMNFTRFIPNERYGCLRSPVFSENILMGNDLKAAFECIYNSSISFQVSTDTNQPLWCLIDSNLGHPSSAGFLGLTISPNGRIQLTSRINEPIGNAKEKNGLHKAYFDYPMLKDLRLGKIRGCKHCKYFTKCRGDRNISYVIHGDFLGPDTHCWHWQENQGLKELLA